MIIAVELGDTQVVQFLVLKKKNRHAIEYTTLQNGLYVAKIYLISWQ